VVEDVVVKEVHVLSHLLVSFLFLFGTVSVCQQFADSSAREQSLTEGFQTKTENASLWTTIRTSSGADTMVLAPCEDLLTYLLTYSSRRGFYRCARVCGLASVVGVDSSDASVAGEQNDRQHGARYAPQAGRVPRLLPRSQAAKSRREGEARGDVQHATDSTATQQPAGVHANRGQDGVGQ